MLPNRLHIFDLSTRTAHGLVAHIVLCIHRSDKIRFAHIELNRIESNRSAHCTRPACERKICISKENLLNDLLPFAKTFDCFSAAAMWSVATCNRMKLICCGQPPASPPQIVCRPKMWNFQITMNRIFASISLLPPALPVSRVRRFFSLHDLRIFINVIEKFQFNGERRGQHTVLQSANSNAGRQASACSLLTFTASIYHRQLVQTKIFRTKRRANKRKGDQWMNAFRCRKTNRR